MASQGNFNCMLRNPCADQILQSVIRQDPFTHTAVWDASPANLKTSQKTKHN